MVNETPILIQSKNQCSTLCGQLLLLQGSSSGPRVSVLKSKQEPATGRYLAAACIAGLPVIKGSPQDES